MQAHSTRVRTNLTLDGATKEKAKEIYKKFGLSLSDAVNIFLNQSVRCHGLPFEMKIPSPETKQAIDETDQRKNIERVSIETLIEDSRPTK